MDGENGQRYPYSLHGYWTTRGYANSRTAKSRTGRLADWSTPGLDNSRTGQVADWTTRRCHQRLCVLSFRSFGGICETASCPVHNLSSPWVDQSASWQSASWCIRELSSYRIHRQNENAVATVPSTLIHNLIHILYNWSLQLDTVY